MSSGSPIVPTSTSCISPADSTCASRTTGAGRSAPLINLINESLWVGHFDLWAEEGRPTWRHALLLRGTDGVEDPQVVDLVTVGVGECERFYPAFEQVVGTELAPETAFEAALMEPRGSA